MTKKHLGILKKSAVQAHPPKLKAKKPKAPKPVLSQPEADAAAGGGKQKRAAAAAAALLQSKTEKHELQQQREWIPHSPVVRFAAEAVAKLIAADESQRSGKSIKSLTLAPHVSTKKATYALTCQTLRCERPRADWSCIIVAATHIITCRQVASEQDLLTMSMCADLPVLQKVLEGSDLLVKCQKVGHCRVLHELFSRTPAAASLALPHTDDKTCCSQCSSRRRWPTCCATRSCSARHSSPRAQQSDACSTPRCLSVPASCWFCTLYTLLSTLLVRITSLPHMCSCTCLKLNIMPQALLREQLQEVVQKGGGKVRRHNVHPAT